MLPVSPEANADDGSCRNVGQPPPQTNMTIRFGGLYQTCNSSGTEQSHDLCSDLSQVNPSTGEATCPAGEYRFDVIVHIFFRLFSIKLKRNKGFKRFWTNNKYTLYKYEMYVKITDINKDKAQVVSNSYNFV